MDQDHHKIKHRKDGLFMLGNWTEKNATIKIMFYNKKVVNPGYN